MWSLPELTWNEQAWRLPLCEHSAAEIALSLFVDANTASARLADVLRGDEPLALWVVCRAGLWRDTAPQAWSDLANWLLSYLVSERIDFQLITSPPRDCWAQLSSRASRPMTTADRDFSVQTFSHADAWFESSKTQPDRNITVRSASWFPPWIPHRKGAETAVDRTVADVGATDYWLQPDARDVVFSDSLPAMLQTRRRSNELETEFDHALEQAKLASLYQFAYGASHEINNPLANIATRAQSLMREEKDPERRRKLATVVSQAFRAHEMISDLMLFAKPPALQLTTWDAATVIREVVRELNADAAQQNTGIHLQLNEDVRLRADQTQIAVAIKALIRNALEALVEGGQIDIQVETEDSFAGRRVVIRVSDNGPGIDPITRRHLFDPYFSGREAGRGLGFGLSKCWRIVTEHGGTISVESSPGSGACFTLQLPTGESEAVHRMDNAHSVTSESHAEKQSSPSPFNALHNR